MKTFYLVAAIPNGWRVRWPRYSGRQAAATAAGPLG